VLMVLTYLRWTTYKPEAMPVRPSPPVTQSPAANSAPAPAVPSEATVTLSAVAAVPATAGGAPTALPSTDAANMSATPAATVTPTVARNVVAPAVLEKNNALSATTASTQSQAIALHAPAQAVAIEPKLESVPDVSILPKVSELSKTLSRPLLRRVIKTNPVVAPLTAETAAASAPVPSATRDVSKARLDQTSPPSAAASGTPRTSPPPSGGVDKRMREMPAESRAELLFRDGVSALQLGRVSDAQSHLEAALTILPGHRSARQALIGLLLDMQRYDQAEQRLVEALAIEPKNARYAMVLARVQIERGDNVSALRALQGAAQYAGEDANYNGFMASVLQRLDIHDKAVEHYQIALKTGPGNSAWLTGMGISLRALGRTIEARDAFTRAQADRALAPELQTYIERQLRELAARKS